MSVLPKSGSMQNQSTSIFLVRPTLNKIKAAVQIGKTLEKVSENAILKLQRKYRK